jgi:aspartyl-tRNA(Asn)/glutamyl-tRNA(Gln) amidotransferase subunit A
VRELWELEARKLATEIRAGAISPVEVVESAAGRIGELDGDLHAFCTLTLDRARQDAAGLEVRLRRGEKVGPLAGVPIAVKDLIATAGVRTAAGAAAYREFVPAEDDVVVERIRAADALILGKTNVSELGYGGVGHNPVFPTTRNPWNRELTPGGSSAGSAVAVATGMSALALGSDGGGSIRIPAALCGIVGIKASMGRVPVYPGCRDERYPGLSSWESLEHIGPLARTVADAALLLSVIAGPDARDRHSIPTTDVDWLGAVGRPVTGLRVGFTEDLGYARVDREVRRLVRDAATVFADQLGCNVEPLAASWPNPQADFETLVALDTDLSGMREITAMHRHEMGAHLVELVERDWSGEEFTDALTGRKRLCNAMWRVMERYDLLLTPVSAVAAFPVDLLGPPTIDGRSVGVNDWSPFTHIANMTGQPAASVPAGLTQDGLPVGLQIIGRHLADATVIRAAAAFQEVAPQRMPPPTTERHLRPASPPTSSGENNRPRAPDDERDPRPTARARQSQQL